MSKKSIKKPRSFYFGIVSNQNNAKIRPLFAGFDGVIYDAEKCNYNPYPEYFHDDVYYFDLSIYSLNLQSKERNHSLGLYCEENCTTADGEPAKINAIIITSDLKIDHSNDNPLIVKGFQGYHHQLIIQKNTTYEYRITFTPILYNSTEVFNTKIKTYVKTLMTSNDLVTVNEDGIFASIFTEMESNCDIYIREYRTLLVTFSKIGDYFLQLNYY